MRGTEQLSDDQKPAGLGGKKRRRKRRGRAQPYRRGTGRGRELGPTLSAIVKGAPQGLPNPMDLKRQAQKKHHRRGR
jgi:hypothetical protein